MVRHIFLILLAFLLVKCLDPFEFEFEDSEIEKHLVIDGVFSTSNGPHKITLSRTQKFGLKTIDPVLGAKVELIHQSQSYNFVEQTEGVYLLHNLSGIEGEEYNLHITLNNGQDYQSLGAVLPKKVNADSVYVEFVDGIRSSVTGNETIAKVINVLIDTNLPGNDDMSFTYLKWLTEELYVFPEESCGGLHMPKSCYIPVRPNLQNLSIFNSEKVTGERLEGFKVSVKNKMSIQEFKALYIFSVYQYAINKESFTYWTKLKTVADQSGTIFDLPPAALQGNVFNVNNPDELVLGYFEVTNIDTVRARVISSEFKENVNPLSACPQFSRFRWGPECCQCLELPDASTERPSWLE